jgi:hypothetical protein
MERGENVVAQGSVGTVFCFAPKSAVTAARNAAQITSFLIASKSSRK